jgi:hypothetical protein
MTNNADLNRLAISSSGNGNWLGARDAHLELNVALGKRSIKETPVRKCRRGK